MMWPSALVIAIIRNASPQSLHFGRCGLRDFGCGATPLPSQYVHPRNSHTSHLMRSSVVREFDAIQP